MKKLDLRKKWKHLHQPSARNIEVVDVPGLSFLMVDGRIEKGKSPGDSPAFLGKARLSRCQGTKANQKTPPQGSKALAHMQITVFQRR
jgi:hypothetical protein